MRHAPEVRALLAALFVLSLAGTASAARVGGYVKNFFIVQRLPGTDAAAGGEPRDGRTLLADNLRTRVEAWLPAAERLDVDLAYNLVPRLQDDDYARLNPLAAESAVSPYRAADLKTFLLPGSPDSTDNFVVLQNLDRASLTLRLSALDLSVGRQAIAWGSARGINPTDVIAPFLFTEIDTEHRIGVDAARARIPAGALGEVDAGYIAGEDFAADKSAVYARVKFYAAHTDIAVLAMRFRRQSLAGLDLARAIGSAGAWLEVAAVRNDDDARTDSPAAGTSVDREAYARFSAGLDYSLGNGTYLYAEYHYNGAGASDPAFYSLVATTPAYTDGAVYLLGRHYLIPGLSWPATPLWTVTASALVGLSDGSWMLAPIVEYNVRENFYLSAGGFAGFGERPLSDPMVFAGAAPTILRSEFGTYPDTFYASLRYYF
jgi:hypothetical protein